MSDKSELRFKLPNFLNFRSKNDGITTISYIEQVHMHIICSSHCIMINDAKLLLYEIKHIVT